MVPEMRAAWCEIDLDALYRNAGAIAGAAGAPILPMVKANAYGHGLGPVALRLAGHPAVWGMGVATVSEAAELRGHGYMGRVLILGGLLPEEVEEVVAVEAVVALSTLSVAGALSRTAQREGTVTPVHLKVDVGMHRLGFPLVEAEEAAAAVAALPGLRLEGVLTHFGAAHGGDDASRARTRVELEQFLGLVERLRSRYGTLLAHAANSSAIMALAGSALDLARPGLALYGWKPAPWLPDEPALMPVATVRARVAVVKEIGRGALVGYSQTPAGAGRRIGILPIGYGDGLPQAWGLVPGRVAFPSGCAPFIGSISMDSCAVDLTDLPAEGEGSTALILGAGPEGTITPDEIASATNRISYEILTGMTERLPRRYLGQGR